MIAIVDVQSIFATKSDEVIKQVVIHNFKEDSYHALTFAPPHDARPNEMCINVNNWLENNHHGINWFHGDIEYKCLESVSRTSLRDYKIVFTKGEQKARFLNKVHDTVIDLSELNCPSLNTLKAGVDIPKSKRVAYSIHNIKALRKWLQR